MTFAAILVLAAGTFAMRFAGPALAGRARLPERVRELLETGAIVILAALVATATVTDGAEFAGWARPAGIAVAAALAVARAPFPAVVIAAAAVTAGLRALGVA
jgi:branched-subunit amino acid transport protein